MAHGREIFRQFLDGEPLSGVAYVPLLRGITARVGGVTAQELTSEATLWANSLAKTAELFDLDGIVAGFDPSLLVEACGCEVCWVDGRPVVGPPPESPLSEPLERGRLPEALEAAKRIFEITKSQRGAVAAVNGPLTLAAGLFSEDKVEKGLAELKPALVQVVEEFCKIRPDALLIMEGGPLVKNGVTPKLKRLYFTLKKIAAYYDVATALYVQDYSREHIGQLAGLKMDVYNLGRDEAGNPPRHQDQWSLAEDCLGIGLGLPPDDPEACRQIIEYGEKIFREHPERRFYFTSLGPVKQTHDPRLQLELVKQIQQIRR